MKDVASDTFKAEVQKQLVRMSLPDLPDSVRAAIDREISRLAKKDTGDGDDGAACRKDDEKLPARPEAA
jgi:hypothetical protein